MRPDDVGEVHWVRVFTVSRRTRLADQNDLLRRGRQNEYYDDNEARAKLSYEQMKLTSTGEGNRVLKWSRLRGR